VRAPIVLCDDLQVLVVLAPVQLVFEPDVREMDLLIEVRQVVLVRPAFDLSRVPIRSAVAVRPPTIRLLQPFLILALELRLEDDAPNVGALLPEALFFAQVGAVHLDVVRELARATDACVERLLTAILTVAPVRLKQVPPALRQRDGALAAFEFYRVSQAFVAQVAEVWFPRI